MYLGIACHEIQYKGKYFCFHQRFKLISTNKSCVKDVLYQCLPAYCPKAAPTSIVAVAVVVASMVVCLCVPALVKLILMGFVLLEISVTVVTLSNPAQMGLVNVGHLPSTTSVCLLCVLYFLFSKTAADVQYLHRRVHQLLKQTNKKLKHQRWENSGIYEPHNC